MLINELFIFVFTVGIAAKMQIAVLGATGNTGLQVIELALAEEQWQVVALVRSPDKLAHINHDRLQV